MNIAKTKSFVIINSNWNFKTFSVPIPWVFFQLSVSHQCWFFKITFHTSVEFGKLKFLGFLGSSPSTYSGPILKIKWTFFPIMKSRVLLLSKNYSICLNCQLQMQVLSFFSPYSLSFFSNWCSLFLINVDFIKLLLILQLNLTN